MRDTESKTREQTKKRIMDSFWEIYENKKIEKITVKEVALKSGVNRSTFYEYFTDCYDVLVQIEDTLIPDINGLPPVEIDGKNFGIPASDFLSMFSENERYYSVLLGENGDPLFVRKSKDAIKNTILNSLFERPGINRKKIDFVLEYTLSAMMGVMHYWFNNRKKMDAEELIKLTSELMDNGVSSYL